MLKSITKQLAFLSHRHNSRIAGIILLLFANSSLAIDMAEKVLINADHMQMNIESGNSTYTGNVKISQGALTLTGDKVKIEQKDNEIDRITVTGKPARYNHVTEDGETIEAESETMVYTASLNKLVMTKNAHLNQPDNKLSSQMIIYDTLKKIVIAGSNSNNSSNGSKTDGKQRVNITLTPKKQPDENTVPENR